MDDSQDAADSLAKLLDLVGYEARVDQVCRRLREQPWGRDITVVALTG